jgi:hypothetical protein
MLKCKIIFYNPCNNNCLSSSTTKLLELNYNKKISQISIILPLYRQTCPIIWTAIVMNSNAHIINNVHVYHAIYLKYYIKDENIKNKKCFSITEPELQANNV